MQPPSPWGPYAEWPKLDLQKRRLTRLALVWTVPNTAWVEEQFAELLDDDGAFLAMAMYTRGKVRHLRVEAAQRGLTTDDPLTVTVEYETDRGTFAAIPKLVLEPAWLLDPLMEVETTSPVQCHAEFRFPSSPRLRTVVTLPAPPAALDGSPYVLDEIRGIHGLKHDDESYWLPGYEFIVDRLLTDDVTLSLKFTQSPGPPELAPAAALDNAVFIARGIVWEDRKRLPKPTAPEAEAEAEAEMEGDTEPSAKTEDEASAAAPPPA